MNLHKLPRLLLFAGALCALIVGVLGGLARFGFTLPAASQAGHHGALMICGLFGTLISLERAVAINKPWPWLAPLFAVCGVLLLLLSKPAAPILFTLAALTLSLACIKLWLGQRVLHLAVLAISALLWLLGNGLWLSSGSILVALPAWLAFLILTIAAERLELSRFLPTPRGARHAFVLLLLLVLIGLLPQCNAAFALGLFGLACWLLRYDIVRHTLKQAGLPRYIAVCLAVGYVWLGVGAALCLSDYRDAMLHALLLGFVVSMVFGHAPIILPAVARLRIPYHPVLYLPLLLLHLTLAIRVLAAPLGDFDMHRYAALGNALALTLFALTVASLLFLPRKT